MTARRIAWAGSAALALAVAGCGGGRQAPPPPRPATILPSAAAALTPALYMQLASASSLFAIRASEMAASRAADTSLRSTARSIAADQGGVGSQLSYAGRRLDLLPRAELPEGMAADLARLEAAADFDAEYRRLVGAALARALEAHETFARGGSSATLRPVAEMAAPVTRRNVEALRRR